MPKLLVIDGNSLMHRAFHALPLLNNAEGEYTNAVYGFMGMLLRLLKEEEPDHVAVAFDMHGPTFRHKEYPEYKAGRKKTPEELRPQFPMLKQVLEAMGISSVEREGLEADDLLGCLAKEAEEVGMQSILVTGDKDALQLVRDGVTVLFTRKGISETDRMDAGAVKEKLGVDPQHVVDLKGLMGDSSDNIPGVPGVGEKTARMLLDEYGDLETVLEHAEEIKRPKLRQNLIEFAEQARVSKHLATIVDEEDCNLNLDEYAFAMPSAGDVRPEFKRLGFESLLKRMGGDDGAAEEREAAPAIKAVQHDNIDDLDELIQAKSLALLFTDTMLYVAKDQTMDHTFAFSQTLLNEGISYEEAMARLKPVFEDTERRLLLFDAKALAHRLAELKINLNAQADDIMLAAYCCDTSQGQKSIADLCEKYAVGNGEEGSSAAALFGLMETMQKEMDENGMAELYAKMELPLWCVLYGMEQEGFRIDIPMLKQMGEDYGKDIEKIVNEIYRYAGEEFNINSSQQLSIVLFEKLGLKGTKKTKTGYSTDIEVLESLRDEHPVIEQIIEYRHATKLKSTYMDGLLAVANKTTGKVHTNFKQNITATGRISSTEPNLQNIPIRTEQGRVIRKVFIPSAEGRVLAAADYSQIELRVLAHMAGDENMIATFSRGGDIHTSTASEVFGVPIEDVTPQLRSAAKAVNFGIVYGIGDFGLGRQLHIPRAQAAEYIEKYLARYPKVHAFMQQCIEDCKKDGYVTTLYGRRRYVNEIKSRNYNVRSFGERIAMNAPIQGTAADIIKVAMINVDAALHKTCPEAKLILQVHDELIVDCSDGDKDKVMDILKENMENVIELRAPLKADVGYGKTWLDAK